MLFKCKMCGGDITPIKDSNIGKCSYCKSTMTLPNLENEKIVNLYNRANYLRLGCDFDKAKEIYENILNIDNEQVEAHWGLLLCKFGVEYVDDPKTKLKIPTCHRTSDYSILNDNEFKMICKKSYGEALELYKREANEIDKIQKNILAISINESPYDVFICYKETEDNGERTYDSVIAQDIYEKLTDKGYKVFFSRITLEDKLGKEYEPYIYSALKSSKVMLVVGTTEAHFNAVWVKNEWSRYLEMIKQDKSKTLIPVYSKIDAYQLPEEFSMLQAQSMEKVGALQDLTRGVGKLIESVKNDNDEQNKANIQSDESKVLGNGLYEVNVIKETLPLWYYFLCIASIGGYFLFSAGMQAWYSLIDIRTYQDLPPSYFDIILRIIIGTYIILLFINRKTHKFAKKNYIFLIFMCIIRFSLYTYNLLVPRSIVHGFMLYVPDVLLIIISHLVTPRWNLNTASKTILNVEDKDKQIKKNKYIKDNFKVIERNKNNKLNIKTMIIIGIISLLSLICSLRVWKYLPYRQSNEKNSEYSQINLHTSKNIFSEKSLDSEILATVRSGDYYNILDLSDSHINPNGSFYGFLEIKTRKGIQGYIYLGEKDDTKPTYYIAKPVHSSEYSINCSKNDKECNKLIEEQMSKIITTNKRDSKVKQVKVITNMINIRKKHSTNSELVYQAIKGDIFTIKDKYIEKITETKWNDDVFSDNFGPYEVVKEKRNWYKITTSNGYTGWICGSIGNEKYLQEL